MSASGIVKQSAPQKPVSLIFTPDARFHGRQFSFSSTTAAYPGPEKGTGALTISAH
jgi:hypothetical protein